MPWWLEPTYRDPVPPGFGATLSLSERRVAARHGLDWGQLAWRRRIIASPAFVGDVGAFLVAYLEDPSTAFPPVASGGALPDRLRHALTARQRAKDWPEPMGGNELDPALRGAAWAGGSPCDEPWVRVWVPPSSRRRWLLVADPSEGLARSDWQAAAVIDPLTGEIAAMAREEIDPARFGTALARLAGIYGAGRDAWVDATGGYAARVTDAAGRSGIALRELRWSGGQRGWAWGEAVADLARDPAVVVCPDLARELLRLRRGRSGRIAAAAGSTDDLVACLALAQVARAEAARGGHASQRDPRFGKLRRRSPLIGW